MTQATIDLSGTCALVTGSSKGIGLGIARYLMADLFEADGPAQLVEDAFAREPELDTLIANAGGYFDKPFLEMEA